MGLLVGVGQTRPQFAYDYYYGIEWDVTVSNPKVARVGKDELHKSLPIQSKMRRCLLKDDGIVNYYLHPNDSTKRDNGAAAVLDGSHGQVMVEIPDIYVRFEMDGNKRRCLMSEYELPGFMKWEKSYISAYEASLERSTSKLASVVNKSVAFRGGLDNAAWDDTYRELLGRPVTGVSLTNFRSYARNRGSIGWNCNTYVEHRKLWWLYAIEYANFNSQDTFIANITEDGYHQGALGAGVTTLNGTKWNEFNAYNPFIPCGATNELGNRTGIVPFTMPSEYDVTPLIVDVPSFRGVENPFGHIWKWTDGCKCLIQSDSDGGLSEFYVCDNPSGYTSSGISNCELRGLLPRVSGYIKEVILGENGEVMPLVVGAGSTTYFSDNFYTSLPASGVSERGVLFGGNASYGASAGFVYSYTSNTASYTNAHIGSRLCFNTGVV